MGLDMYLYRKHYVQNWDFETKKWNITIEYDGQPVPSSQIDPAKLAYITEQVAYWRKANQIHTWFVKNVQDGVDECQYSYVSEERLQTLLETVRSVLTNHSLAAELLPTQSGFFFGGCEYDEYYFEDLTKTEKMLALLLEEKERSPGFEEYEYHSSW